MNGCMSPVWSMRKFSWHSFDSAFFEATCSVRRAVWGEGGRGGGVGVYVCVGNGSEKPRQRQKVRKGTRHPKAKFAEQSRNRRRAAKLSGRSAGTMHKDRAYTDTTGESRRKERGQPRQTH